MPAKLSASLFCGAPSNGASCAHSHGAMWQCCGHDFSVAVSKTRYRRNGLLLASGSRGITVHHRREGMAGGAETWVINHSLSMCREQRRGAGSGAGRKSLPLRAALPSARLHHPLGRSVQIPEPIGDLSHLNHNIPPLASIGSQPYHDAKMHLG